MLIFLSLLSIYRAADNYFSRRRYAKSADISCFLEKLDEIVDEGMTVRDFNYCLTNSTDFAENYHKIIDIITNDSYALDESFFETKVSSYFNLDNSLLTLFPNISFLEEQKELFQSLRPIIADLGPDLCNVLNLDFNSIMGLYDYVLINKEEDGIKFGRVIQLLGIPTDFVNRFSKIFQFFDPNLAPVSVLMEGANVKSEYDRFLRDVQTLRIPSNEGERFFSFIRVINSISTGVDVVSGFINNFIQKHINEIITPLIKTYVIKPVNIFEKSIYDRATALVSALVKFQDYALSCDKAPDQRTDLDNSRCMAFTTIIELISNVMLQTARVLSEFDDQYDEGTNDTKIDLNLIKERVSSFTNEEINLTESLINFNVPENYIKFVFGGIANLTDLNKNYVNLLEGTDLIFTDKNYDESGKEQPDYWTKKIREVFYPDDSQQPSNFESMNLHRIINNLTQIIKFIDSLDDVSNFKVLFEYFGIEEYWDTFSKVMELVDGDATVCDNGIIEALGLDSDSCTSLVNSVEQISDMLTTLKQFKTLFSGKIEIIKFLLDCIAPLFQQIDLRISLLINLLHKVLIRPLVNLNTNINLPKNVDYSKLVQSSGNLLTKSFTLIDDVTPILVKKIPFLGDYFTKFVGKVIGFLGLIRDNVDLATFFEFFLGGSSVITKMLKSAANAYIENDKITGADFAKAFQPTSFLNVFETAKGTQSIANMKIKDLAKSIKFGSSIEANLLGDELTINNLFPLKTIVENSHELTASFHNNSLNLSLVARSLGTEETSVKQTMTSVIQSALWPPAEAIIASSVNSGYDMETIMAYLNGIGEFSQKVSNGELVKSRTDEYIKLKTNKKKLSTGAIVGIVIACVVVVGAAVFVGIYFGIIRKKKNADNQSNTQDASA